MLGLLNPCLSLLPWPNSLHLWERWGTPSLGTSLGFKLLESEWALSDLYSYTNLAMTMKNQISPQSVFSKHSLTFCGPCPHFLRKALCHKSRFLTLLVAFQLRPPWNGVSTSPEKGGKDRGNLSALFSISWMLLRTNSLPDTEVWLKCLCYFILMEECRSWLKMKKICKYKLAFHGG